MIPLGSFRLPRGQVVRTSTGLTSKSTSEAWDGDSSSTTTIDSTSKKAPSSLLSVLQQTKTITN